MGSEQEYISGCQYDTIQGCSIYNKSDFKVVDVKPDPTKNFSCWLRNASNTSINVRNSTTKKKKPKKIETAKKKNKKKHKEYSKVKKSKKKSKVKKSKKKSKMK